MTKIALAKWWVLKNSHHNKVNISTGLVKLGKRFQYLETKAFPRGNLMLFRCWYMLWTYWSSHLDAAFRDQLSEYWIPSEFATWRVRFYCVTRLLHTKISNPGFFDKNLVANTTFSWLSPFGLFWCYYFVLFIQYDINFDYSINLITAYPKPRFHSLNKMLLHCFTWNRSSNVNMQMGPLSQQTNVFYSGLTLIHCSSSYF